VEFLSPIVFSLPGFHVNLCMFAVIIDLCILYNFGAREKVLEEFSSAFDAFIEILESILKISSPSLIPSS